MTDPETQPASHQPEAGASNTSGGDNNQDEAEVKKRVIATKVTGTVKWFNVKSGYGFINRNDTQEDVFVHQMAIMKNNPNKAVRSLGDGEVCFYIFFCKKQQKTHFCPYTISNNSLVNLNDFYRSNITVDHSRTEVICITLKCSILFPLQDSYSYIKKNM